MVLVGRISLTEHCKSNEHAEKLKIKANNYTLGVPKANSKSYGIHPFFLQSRKDIQQPETVKTIIPLDQRVANAQVCILYRKAFRFAKKHVFLR